MSADRRIGLAPAVARRFPGGIIVGRPGGDVVELRGLAADVYRELAGPMTAAELEVALTVQHGDGGSELRRHIEATIEGLGDLLDDQNPVALPWTYGPVPTDWLEPHLPPPGTDLVEWARRMRIVAVMDATGLCPAGTFDEDLREQAELGVRIELCAIEVTELFDDAALEHMWFKGIATSRLDHTCPEHRQFGDADVLVRPDEGERAHDVLLAAGYVEIKKRPGDGFLWRERTYRSPSGVELDLHIHLFRFGKPEPEQLWATRKTAALAGSKLPCADEPVRGAISVLHQFFSPPTVRRLTGSLDRAMQPDRPERARFAELLGLPRCFDSADRMAATGRIGQRRQSRPNDRVAAWAFARHDRFWIAEQLAVITAPMPKAGRIGASYVTRLSRGRRPCQS